MLLRYLFERDREGILLRRWCAVLARAPPVPLLIWSMSLDQNQALLSPQPRGPNQGHRRRTLSMTFFAGPTSDMLPFLVPASTKESRPCPSSKCTCVSHSFVKLTPWKPYICSNSRPQIVAQASVHQRSVVPHKKRTRKIPMSATCAISHSGGFPS